MGVDKCGVDPEGRPVKHLVVRADATFRIGSGHVMRCLALMQRWRAHGGQTTLLGSIESPVLRERVQQEIGIVAPIDGLAGTDADLEQTTAIVRQLSDRTGRSPALVLDGYSFGAAYQRALQSEVDCMLIIDDIAHQSEYCASVLLNQNIDAEKLIYNCNRTTRLLLGTRFVLLRDEFLRHRQPVRRVPKQAVRILVTLGGADSGAAATELALAGLQRSGVPFDEVTVLCAASAVQKARLAGAVRAFDLPIRLLNDARSVPEVMAASDLAISAAGSTCWEMAFMGLPAILLTLFDNQAGIARGLHEHGAAMSLGWSADVNVTRLADAIRHLVVDREKRQAMSDVGHRLVDDGGAERVLAALSGAA